MSFQLIQSQDSFTMECLFLLDMSSFPHQGKLFGSDLPHTFLSPRLIF